jgi:two-component system response regulator HydG
MARILLVDDDSNFTHATRLLLKAESHSVETAATVKDANRLIKAEKFDLMFVDLALPDGSGLELINDGAPKAVIITGHPSVETAIKAVRGPVIDYLVKPLDKAQLLNSIDEAESDTPAKRSGPVEFARPATMVGESGAMKKVLKAIAEYGPTDVTVLISGESGTGKDLVAKALHVARNKGARFVPVNCGAIPRELIASELFGHEKGSFTGAATKRIGIFERAKGGTVFLDEVGELPLDQQVALLRVLETNAITRVGGEQEVPVSARIVAATNKDLEKAVRKGSFREDLYFRLMVLPIHVPPLRERKDDIEPLANYFLEQYASEHGASTTFGPDIIEKLNRYSWPGNVRELKHAILRAAIMNRGREKIEELPSDFDRPPSWSSDPDSLQPGMSIRDVEKKLIQKTLQHFDGNKKSTAEALGISLKTLYNRLCEYDETKSAAKSAEHDY